MDGECTEKANIQSMLKKLYVRRDPHGPSVRHIYPIESISCASFLSASSYSVAWFMMCFLCVLAGIGKHHSTVMATLLVSVTLHLEHTDERLSTFPVQHLARVASGARSKKKST
jgi:hypothetical protein